MTREMEESKLQGQCSNEQLPDMLVANENTT